MTLLDGTAEALSQIEPRQLQAFSREFRETGRVLIPDVLTDAFASRVQHAFASRASWRRISSAEGEPFTFRYDQIIPPLPGQPFAEDDVIAATARALRSTAFKAEMAQLLGLPDRFMVDVQATRYGPGDYIDPHEDDPEGQERQVAYVLGLTKPWKPHWGGLLLFPGEGAAISGYMPSFNTLTLFRVPRLHLVTPVAAGAPPTRFCFSGWFRLTPGDHQGSPQVRSEQGTTKLQRKR